MQFADRKLGRRILISAASAVALICFGLSVGVWRFTNCNVLDYIGRASSSPRDLNDRYLFACGYVWHSLDGGKVWNRVDPGGLPFGTRDGFIAVGHRSGQLFLGALITSQSSIHCWDCAWKNLRPAIYTSLDGGHTWAFTYKFKRGPAGNGGFIGLYVDPIDDNNVYAVIKNADEITFYNSGTSAQFWKPACSEFYDIGRICHLPDAVMQVQNELIHPGIENTE
ncbi:MAG TPA: hypothetical protein VI547_15975 [Anaerolineales bacterium]|nr:hypothetical protein [Anaerolineales bacterium]HLF03483.1 hypothetical protein [Anaerolineales bacterium]